MIKKRIRSFILYIEHILFPQKPELARIERMTPAEFASEASRPIDPPPAGIHSLFKYKDPLVRRALLEVKYSGNKIIARLFARLLSETIIEVMADEALYNNFTKPIIIPVPLSRERLRERGWNQAEMIAQEVAKILKACLTACNFKSPDDRSLGFLKLHAARLAPTLHTSILKKIKNTESQTKLSREKRIKNLKGCFLVSKPELIKNKNIILIDDITTTGSTIEEARRALISAGARKVIAFTVAH